VRFVSVNPFEDSGKSFLDVPGHQLTAVSVHPADPNQFALAREDEGFGGLVRWIYS
jgi:hypothetical protein